MSIQLPLTGYKLGFSFLCFYSPCVVSLCCGIIIVIRNQMPVEVAVPGTEYIEIGQMKLGEYANRINFFMMVLGIYGAPIGAFWLRR
uniref:7TM_GPCR_Srx domain-containing protein n=1 Tax=Caenorhabditis tropicalis TaxID=1561998 RepID=A0A1I7TQM5_9PELO